jgi:sulfatase modifying factor 1
MTRAAALVMLVAATALVAGPLPRPRESGARGDVVYAAAGVKESATPAEAARAAPCPAGMLEIDGDYYNYVEQYCTRWLQVERDRCGEFAQTGRTFGSPTHFHFCIDEYEWPNVRGTKPDVSVDWDTAKARCTAAGKRLCEDREWTLACEGREMLPYPYGYARDPDACNIDRPYILPNDAAYKDPATRAQEVLRLDQRDPSGAREGCVSPYGVHDMTGNVDEWVVNPPGKVGEKPYRSGLKGGYWGPVRNRCRPMTVDHNEWHSGYQIGFRCCAAVGATAVAPPAATGVTGG